MHEPEAHSELRVAITRMVGFGHDAAHIRNVALQYAEIACDPPLAKDTVESILSDQLLRLTPTQRVPAAPVVPDDDLPPAEAIDARGNLDPDIEADLVPIARPTNGSRLAFLSVSDLLSRPYPAWTVLDLVPEQGLMVVYGGPGSGKTFFMLDMGIHVARGRPWYGRRVKRGQVLYIAAEGALSNRIRAYQMHHELDNSDFENFGVLESGINLLDPAADLLPLMEAIKTAVDQSGVPVRLVIIDTLARSMPGGNENASEDMGAVIYAAGKIEKAFNCVVAFIHHSGKDDTKGSRGHSSLKGATDVEISIRRDGDVRQAIAEKVRDGADGETLLTFKLTSLDLMPRHRVDPEADPIEMIRSCVVTPCDSGEMNGQKLKIRGEISGAIVEKLVSGSAGQKKTQFVSELSERYTKDSVRRTLDRLIEAGYVTEVAGIIGKGPLINANREH